MPTAINLTGPASFGGTGNLTIPIVTGGFGLTKVASNTLTLTGLSTYTGPTTVAAGVLNVNGSLAAASAVTVSATATLGGTGTVSGAVTDKGTINPGTVGATGTLTLAGGLTFAASSAYNVDVSGSASDKIVVTGSVSLSTATLHVTGVGPTAASYTLVQATGGITGTFAADPEGTPISVGGYQTKNAGFITPEPTSCCCPHHRSSPARRPRRNPPASATRLPRPLPVAGRSPCPKPRATRCRRA